MARRLRRLFPTLPTISAWIFGCLCVLTYFICQVCEGKRLLRQRLRWIGGRMGIYLYFIKQGEGISWLDFSFNTMLIWCKAGILWPPWCSGGLREVIGTRKELPFAFTYLTNGIAWHTEAAKHHTEVRLETVSLVSLPLQYWFLLLVELEMRVFLAGNCWINSSFVVNSVRHSTQEHSENWFLHHLLYAP